MQAHPPLSCIANRSCPGTNPLCAMNSTVGDPLGDFRDNEMMVLRAPVMDLLDLGVWPPLQAASKQASVRASKQASEQQAGVSSPRAVFYEEGAVCSARRAAL